MRRQGAAWATAAAILGTLAGCGSLPDAPPPVADASTPAATTAPAGRDILQRSGARWVAADWAELPGWSQDRVAEAWPALLRSCERPQPPWQAPCAAARGVPGDEASVRAWLQRHLRPWRVETTAGEAAGLLTGYFEPLVDARRQPDAVFRHALHAPPADLARRQPWWTREQAQREPAARAALAGRELAFVADPLQALSLQIQGSGRVRLLDAPGADGQPRVVRLAFAGHNGQPYQSVGRWLIQQGELSADGANWPAIRAWAQLHPQRVDEMLAANPRLVFFREQPLPDPGIGPVGAQGVPLTPGRSIAVDRSALPYGTPVWLVSTEPQPWQPAAQAPLPRPLQRLVIAQDTGSAITGAVRADYFWGWGEEAEAQAGRTRQPLRMWVLWPRNAAVGS
ncbi:MAG: MltA domain-containing protein [Burkholderiales bacterium]|nr:MltA domain-containing protein [Burkholderiales bacterium]